MDNYILNPERDVNKPKKKKDKYGEDYEYSPATQRVTSSQLYGGLMIRALCAVLMNFGFLLCIKSSFSLAAGVFTLFIYSLVSTFVFSLIFIGGKAAIAGAGLGVLSSAVVLIAHPNIVQYYTACIMNTMSAAGAKLVSYGYDNMAFLINDHSNLGQTNSAMHGGALMLLAIVFAFVLSFSIIRKTYLIPVVLLAVAACGVGFAYNFVNSNWGFAFVILSFSAIVTMKLFDMAYKTKRADRLRTASLGGYTGGAVALIALLCLFIPSITMKKQWAEIPFVSQPVNVARDVFTSVLSGDMPNLKDMGIIKGMDEQNSRQINTIPKDYKGKVIFEVGTTYGEDIPVYLRGWVASGFDGKSWLSPTNDEMAYFSESLSEKSTAAGYEGEYYSPDNMSAAFWEMVFGEEMEERLGENYDKTDHGFVSMKLDINLKLGAGTGNLLFLPAVTDVQEGIYAFESSEAEYKGQVRTYYDGMVLTNWFNLNKSYRTRSYVQVMSGSQVFENFDINFRYVAAMRELIAYERENQDLTQTQYTVKKIQVMSYYGLSSEEETYFDSYLKLDEEQKNLAYAKYVLMVDAYSEYANQKYGKAAAINNAHVKGVTEAVLATLESGANATQSEKVMAAVNYMVKNYRYTLTPAAGTAPGLTSLESFLSETKQGYCVHFATAVTLILREMGITARYVEGYVASDFSLNQDGVMQSEVTDFNYHSWVEVYYESYGWMTYETTSFYAKDYYGTNVNLSSGGGSYTPPPPSGDSGNLPDDDVNYVPPVTEVEPEPGVKRRIDWGKVLKNIFIIAVLVTGGTFFVLKMRDKGDEVVAKRRKLIESAVMQYVDDDEFFEVSHAINSDILRMLHVAKYPPLVGELPKDYAKRLDENSMYATNASFEDVMTLMQRQEFGAKIDMDELKSVAEYFETLWRDIYGSQSKFNKIWYRYVLRVI